MELTHEKALEKLELEQSASQQEIQQNYVKFSKEFDMRISNAPTERLRILYNGRKKELKEAYLFLSNLVAKKHIEEDVYKDLPGFEKKTSNIYNPKVEGFVESDIRQQNSSLMLSLLRDSFKMSVCENGRIFSVNIPFWLQENYNKKELECGNPQVLNLFFCNFIEVLLDYVEKVNDIVICHIVFNLPLLKTGDLRLINFLNIKLKNQCFFVSATSAMAYYLVDTDTRCPEDFEELFLFIDGDYCEINLIVFGDGVIESKIRVILPSISNLHMVHEYFELVKKYSSEPISNIVVSGDSTEKSNCYMILVKKIFNNVNVKNYFKNQLFQEEWQLNWIF